MGKRNLIQLRDALETARAAVCPYSLQWQLGGPKTCDCKSGLLDEASRTPLDRLDYERTGCPELRDTVIFIDNILNASPEGEPR